MMTSEQIPDVSSGLSHDTPVTAAQTTAHTRLLSARMTNPIQNLTNNCMTLFTSERMHFCGEWWADSTVSHVLTIWDSTTILKQVFSDTSLRSPESL